MKDGATKSVVQAYNAQAAVDGAAQIIVAAIDLYVVSDRQKHREDVSAPVLDDGAVIGTMRAKLQTAGGRVVYAPRKAIAEPAFGQIKDARHFRRFSFCGLVKVRAEWLPICPTHNLLKLFRVGWTPHPA
ncbi:MAG: transposase [Deltaproteobacteria bacterium]